MAQEQNGALQFFAQIEGMSGEQLAERGRIGRVVQRWMETPWSRRDHTLQDLAFATAEIFGLLQGNNALFRCSSFSDTDEEQVVRQELAADGGGFDAHVQEDGEGFQRDLGVCVPPLDIFRSDEASCFIPGVQAAHDVLKVLNACHCFRLCEMGGECVPVVFPSKLRFTVFEANRNISVSWN